MMLEAVWFKKGKEVYKVCPVNNIVCFDNMESINEIEIEDGHRWHSCEENKFDADDFIIRVRKDKRVRKNENKN